MKNRLNFMVYMTLGLIVFMLFLATPPGWAVLNAMFPEVDFRTVDDIQELSRCFMLLGLPFVAIGLIFGLVSLCQALSKAMAFSSSGKALFEEQNKNTFSDEDDGFYEYNSSIKSPYVRYKLAKEVAKYHTYAPVVLGIQRVVALVLILFLMEVFINMNALMLTPSEAVRATIGVRVENIKYGTDVLRPVRKMPGRY